MHAMSETTPTPVQRRRLTFKRLLLALVLGLAAWWSVGWWLAVRPDFVLRYPDRGSLKSLEKRTGNQKAEFRVVPTYDGPDLLVIQIPHLKQPDYVTLEFRDPATGNLRKTINHSAREYFGSSEAHMIDQSPGDVIYEYFWLEVYLDGKADSITFIAHDDLPHTVPGTNQRVVMRDSLDEMVRWLENWPWLAGLISRLHGHREIALVEVEGDRRLWGLPRRDQQGEGLRVYSAKGSRRVLFHRTYSSEHELLAFTLPVHASSPWWPRSAGLLIAALVLVGRQGRGGFVGGVAARQN
jgi:hypothetical protein